MPLLKIIFELFHAHQHFPRFGSFFRTDNTGIRKLIHDAGSSVESDLEHSLEHTDRCFVFFNDKLSGICKVFIYIASAIFQILGQPSDLCTEPLEEVKKKKILFVAGGVGTAPVYPQVKWLHEHGIDADVIVGAKTKDLVILEKELSEVAGNLYVTTDDGSYGRSGMVTKVIEDLVTKEGKVYDHCVAIGPMIMMKFCCLTTKKLNIPTIVSMNPIMVDGTGMCGACRVMVGDEVKFACVDGPEFDGHKIDFDVAMKRQTLYKTEEGRALLKLREGDTHHGGCGNCGGDK